VYIAVLILTILVAAFLMAVILMQASKGGGLSATFGGGGGGGDAILSSRQAATVLHKLTIYLVAGFLFLCLLATIISGRRDVAPQAATASALEAQSASATAASTFNPSIPILPESGSDGTSDSETE
jgi:preprotein translocase subunit SecG